MTTSRPDGRQQSPHHYHPGRHGRSARSSRSLTLIIALPLLAGCTDTRAVRAFAGLAPDPAKLHVLAAEYAHAPLRMREIDLMDRMGPPQAPDLARPQQVKALDALHSVLVDYMQALGALAGADLVKTSDQVDALRNGLTALKTADPNLGITDAEIGAGTSIAQLLAGMLVAGMQQAALRDIIETYDTAFQQLISAEVKIIERGLRRDLRSIRLQLEESRPVLAALSRDIESYRAEAGLGGTGEPRLRPRGAAAARAARFALRDLDRAASARLAEIDAAAADYVKALGKIGEAHHALYLRRNEVLTRAALEAIAPHVQAAGAALKALAKL